MRCKKDRRQEETRGLGGRGGAIPCPVCLVSPRPPATRRRSVFAALCPGKENVSHAQFPDFIAYFTARSFCPFYTALVTPLLLLYRDCVFFLNFSTVHARLQDKLYIKPAAAAGRVTIVRGVAVGVVGGGERVDFPSVLRIKTNSNSDTACKDQLKKKKPNEGFGLTTEPASAANIAAVYLRHEI